MAGCSGKSSENSKTQQDNSESRLAKGIKNSEVSTEADRRKRAILSELKAPPAPATMDDLVNYPPGMFAGMNYTNGGREDMEKVLDEMPDFKGISGDEEINEALFKKLVSIFAWEYKYLPGLEQKSITMPEFDDPRYRFKENFNVEVILDASGSMKAKIDGKTKLAIAKEAINQFTSSLPNNANVSLRVYGHVGGGKENSCNKIEQIYGMKPYGADEFKAALNNVNAVGWTPLAKALDEAKQDMAHLDGETNTNLIYFVSDGIETCGGDPVRAAKEIAVSNIQPVVHIIGFDVPSDEQQQLKEMAGAANGIYVSAKNQKELIAELNKVKELARRWESWKRDSTIYLDSDDNEKWLEILKYKTEMTSAALEEKLTIHFAADYLYNFGDGKINRKTRDYIYSRANEREDVIKNSAKEIEKQATEVRHNQYQDSKNLIEETYDKNVNELNN